MSNGFTLVEIQLLLSAAGSNDFPSTIEFMKK